MSAQKFTLFSSVVCPWAQRARVAIAETGLKAETVEIDLTRPRDPWYLEINPYGQVPALKVEGEDFVILESNIVAKYIAELHPEAGLIVADPKERAQSDFLIHQFSNRVHSVFFKFIHTLDKVKRNELEADFLKQLHDFTRFLEKASQSTGKGPFIHGAKFTFADLSLAPLVSRYFLAERLHPDYKFPNRKSHPELSRFFDWQDAVLARPSVISTTEDKDVLTELSKKYLH
ncbi:hypothetical protein DFQ27_000752 [Actinomortierella ambigua]|uniref:Glutathione S-transferase n=1 Tax=Actinomortierella ambigua TaxID=1343610 RepID=A0A9P6UD04_9FUNG|nr:hypothetical protein DFQ27_000752 [Actinomortierella ambigua]